MKYKVGDKVRVRKDLEVGKCYGTISLYSGHMSTTRGATTKINYLSPTGNYHCSNGYFMSPEMLEPINWWNGLKIFIRGLFYEN